MPRRLRPSGHTPQTADPAATDGAAPAAGSLTLAYSAGSATGGSDAASASTTPASAPPRHFPDPIAHLIPHGSICTLSGASGVGKTAFLATLIRLMQTGGEFLGHTVNKPPAIGVLVCDRPWRDHEQWFNKAGCDPLPHLSLRDEYGYNWDILRRPAEIPKIFGGLIDAIKLPPGSLLIVDPLPLFIPGRLIDYKDVAIGLGHLDQQLHQRQLTMIGIFHVSKQKGNKNDRYLRPQDRILGSSALIGYSETAFYLLGPEEAESEFHLFGAVAHQLPPMSVNYARTPDGLFIPATESHALDTAAAHDAALACLPAPGTTISTSVAEALIIRQLACTDRTARRYLQALRADNRLTKVGRGLYERTI